MKFSRDDERRLTTSGAGHIRFWKLANTFTGLKLQGSIGKFGKAELCDISAFVELPDGKVVSGTSNGSLLLWEDNFIKCRYVRKGGLPCHSGEVTYVGLDKDENRLITASVDGFIRWWNIDIIEQSEVDSDKSINYELVPDVEYQLDEGRGIVMMVDSGLVEEGRTFFIVDTSGSSRSIYFYLGEELEVIPKPGLIKRRNIRDNIDEILVKRMRKLVTVLKNINIKSLKMMKKLNGEISDSPIKKNFSNEKNIIEEGKEKKLDINEMHLHASETIHETNSTDKADTDSKLASSRDSDTLHSELHGVTPHDHPLPVTIKFGDYHAGSITGNSQSD